MASVFRANWRLKPSILTAFILLTVPLFCAIVVVTFLSIERSARENAHQVIGRYRADAIDSIRNEFRAIESLARSAAAVGDDFPEFYLNADSADYFLSLLEHDPRIISAYVGMSDGLFRQTRRLDPNVPIFDGPPPSDARIAYRQILPSETTAIDRYDFFDAEMNPLGAAEAPTTYDPRGRLWYRSAANAGQTTISDPDAFAALDLVGFTIAAPFYTDDRLRGVAAIDITLDGFSAHLAERNVSIGTRSYVLDRQGMVIAANDASEVTYEVVEGALELRHVTSLDAELPAVAYSLRPRDDADTYAFEHEGEEYLASLTPLGGDFSKRWQIFVITPISDFTHVFQESNERLAMYGVGAMLLQILVVYMMTGALSGPLERLARKVERIQEFGTERLDSVASSIKEVSVLSSAVDTLDAAVKSFAAFVPVGLVKELVASEQRLELGGHSRFLTVFFSDLQSFSTLSEELPTRELMQRVSAHFDLTTKSVNSEHGTIDKFIGDGVMAFWGAPALLEEHAWHACVAAVRIQRGMDKLNAGWIAQDLKPLIVRIGLHSDAVLVGNIGSEARMSYTVMGDGVNIAARLEGINKAYGSRICISHAVFKEAGDRLCVRPIEDVAVKGRRSKIPIYELLGVYETDDPSLEPTPEDERLAAMSREAYRARVSGDLAEARRLYGEILEAFEGDTVARALLDGLEQE